MAAVKDMLAVVLLGLCVAAGVAHGFVVNQGPGADSASPYSTVDGNARGGRLVDEIKDFQMEGFRTYDPTQESSSGSSGDEGYANNARFQLQTNDVNVDSAARYDYNPSGKVVPAKKVPAGESRPSYLYNARTGKHGGSADAALFESTESEQHESSAHRAKHPKGHQGPVSYYTPSSDRHGPFVFSNTRSVAQKNLSSTVDHDSASAATSSASTTSLLGSQHSPRGTHGCPNSYWAEHVGQWPAPLKITTLVAQAFGGVTVKANLEIVYGTTTLFQALLDTRNDPYSKLLRHAVAALLNAHAKPAFPLRPAVVAKLFHAALASEVAAAAQAQKFENENHSFGDNECK